MRIKKSAHFVCYFVWVFVFKLLLIGATSSWIFSSSLSLLFKSSAHQTSLLVWSQIYLPSSATGHRLQIVFQLEAEGRVFTSHAHNCFLTFSRQATPSYLHAKGPAAKRHVRWGVAVTVCCSCRSCNNAKHSGLHWSGLGLSIKRSLSVWKWRVNLLRLSCTDFGV